MNALVIKASEVKTATAAFNLNNREAERDLNITNGGKLLPFSSVRPIVV